MNKNIIKNFSGILFLFLLIFTACKQNSSVPGILSVFSDMSSMSTDEIRFLYTKETIRAADELSAKRSIKDPLSAYDSRIFDKRAKLEIINEKITSDRAEIDVLIHEHPIINLTGMVHKINLKIENGDWKIDRASEIKNAL